MTEKLPLSDAMPEAPSFSDEELRRCQETGDYRPILFEWYKFVGGLANVVAHIQRDSPAFRKIPELQYYVLMGLLNRCSRLMLSNVALSHQGKFGETTVIVDRCIFESAVKISWLCTDSSPEKFSRYLADGLKTELELKDHIEENVAARNGKQLPIEARMLASIANHISASNLSEAEILASKKLPDVASMLSVIGLNRLLYVAAQKIGSHHIHGTWPGLLSHYLEEESAGSRVFVPRGHDCPTHKNQYLFVPLIVLLALSSYVDYVLEPDEAAAFGALFKSAEEEFIRIAKQADGDDFVG